VQPAVTQRCYRHPDREALIRCTRCDRPICPDCMRPASVGFHCPDDVSEGARTVRAPRTAVGARLLQSRPYVTITLGVLNVVAYLYTSTQSVRGISDPSAVRGTSALFYKWQLFPPAVHDGAYDRLLTSAFLHLSPLHIVFNMIALGVLGPPIEALLGRWRFTALYLLSALGGGAAVYAFGSQYSATVGASGAIFGLFAAALVMVRQLRLDPQWLIGTVVLNFVVTFSIQGVSKLGHIGGFVTGALVALAIAGLPQLRARVPAGWQGAGLGAVAGLIVVVVAVRTLTW
jgi:membrane associated rhomboid family serine protease